MKKILIIIAILTLTGCVEKSRFDCPYAKGPSCLSMSEIDKNNKTNTINKLSCGKDSCVKSSCTKKSVTQASVSRPVKLPVQTDANPALRVPETVLQMWVSPYEANNGIYYQASFINIIVKDAAWQAPVLDDASTREAYNG